MKTHSTSRQNAEVITCNKYNQSSNFIFSTFCIDVVYKLSNGIKIAKTIRDIDLPIYTGQQVELIWADDVLIAYEDKDSKESYYLTANPADEFYNKYLNWTTVIIVTIILLILFPLLLPQHQKFTAFVLLLPIVFRVYRLITNYFMNKSIDNVIAN